MSKNVTVKVNRVRNKCMADDVFEYEGIDKYGYTYIFESPNKIPYNSDMYIRLYDYDVFADGKRVVCLSYTLYNLW